jgi:hypothetical protein
MLSFSINEYTIYQHLKNKEELPDPHLPFNFYWLYSKVINQQRLDNVPLMTEIAFAKAMQGLVKKFVLKNEYNDRYYFLDKNVTAL